MQVVAGEGPDLMGRDCFSGLKVTVKLGNVNMVKDKTSLQKILKKHSTVFAEGLGCLKGMVVKLNVDSSVKLEQCLSPSSIGCKKS